jgi:hypothetical protein
MDLASVSCWLRDVITVWFWITFTSRPCHSRFYGLIWAIEEMNTWMLCSFSWQEIITIMSLFTSYCHCQAWQCVWVPKLCSLAMVGFHKSRSRQLFLLLLSCGVGVRGIEFLLYINVAFASGLELEPRPGFLDLQWHGKFWHSFFFLSLVWEQCI